MSDLGSIVAYAREAQRRRCCEGLDLNVCYLTVKDVMRHCGLKRSAVHYHVDRGHLAPARPHDFKEKYLFHPDEVKRFRREYLKQETQ